MQQIKFNDSSLKQNTQSILHRLMEKVASNPGQRQMIDMIDFLGLCRQIGIEADLWECQNVYYDLRQQEFFQHMAPDLSELFDELGYQLGFIFGHDLVENPAIGLQRDL